MASIYDENFFERGVEVDISDLFERDQAKYESENKDHITVTIIKEPERPPMTEEEQADFEISRARIDFVLGAGTQKEWEDVKKKWGRK